MGPHVSKDIYNHLIDPSEHGTHNILGHIKAAIKHGRELGVTVAAAAIFVAGPKGSRINVTDDESREIHEFVNTYEGIYGHNFYLGAHGKYTNQIIWNRPENWGIITEEMRVADACGLKDLVIHLPNDLPHTAVHESIKRIKKQWKTRLMLETPAVVKSKAYYSRPDEIEKLFSKLGPDVGFCIDSAHLWSNEVSFENYKPTMHWLEQMRAALGKNKNPIMFHLNDSMKRFGVAPDTHESLMNGYIWGQSKNVEETGITAILEFAEKYECPVILERKTLSGLENDYTVVEKWMQ